jgi:hypothetical protein
MYYKLTSDFCINEDYVSKIQYIKINYSSKIYILTENGEIIIKLPFGLTINEIIKRLNFNFYNICDIAINKLLFQKADIITIGSDHEIVIDNFNLSIDFNYDSARNTFNKIYNDLLKNDRNVFRFGPFLIIDYSKFIDSGLFCVDSDKNLYIQFKDTKTEIYELYDMKYNDFIDKAMKDLTKLMNT